MLEKYGNKAAQRLLAKAEDRWLADQNRIAQLEAENKDLRDTNEMLWKTRDPLLVLIEEDALS